MGDQHSVRSATATLESDRKTRDAAWDPDLAEELYRTLFLTPLEREAFDGKVAELEGRYSDAVYSQLLYLLCHLRFEPAEARRCWHEAMVHRAMLESKLGEEIDLRVVIVSYFTSVNRKLENPKIIELKLFEQTQASAYRDELTGLHNYRFFYEYLTQELLRSERFCEPLSLVMIDVDHFKNYNDTHGHEAGNQVLATIARLLRESLRKVDIPARYGGEEFALVLPSTPKIGAQLVAERSRKLIAEHPFPHGADQPGGCISISLGIATHPADATDSQELVRRADRALYMAKSGGRNQVQLYGHSCRSFRRVETVLNGTYRSLEGVEYSLTTINVSQGGLLFRAPRRMPIGSLVEIHLGLPDSGTAVTMTARVISIEQDLDEFEIAVSIVDLGTRDKMLLQRYINQSTPHVETDDLLML